MSYKRWTMVLMTCVLALGLTAGTAYAGERASAKKSTAKRPVAAKTFNARAAMIASADTYFTNSPSPVISAAVVYAALQAKDTSYQIVDVRTAADYARGHIDGAINIPFTTIADDANVAKLDSTKTIVTVCYTGETASMTNMVWSMMGYHVTTLMYGMTGWSTDAAVVGIGIPTGKAAGYATTTRPTLARRTYRAPKLKGKYADLASAVKGQAKAYFAKGLSPIITAGDVHHIVATHDTRHYQIVSVRQKADYAKGHIKGAINIVWTDIADSMRKLDPKKTTIVYCYTGNTGAQDAMFLNLMGYKTYNMMSGMAAWNSDPAVGGYVGFDPKLIVNYPVIK
jgi:rhodanese-related sulfurtransferase